MSRQGTRLAAILIAVTLAFALVACGGSESSPSSGEGSTATTTGTGGGGGSDGQQKSDGQPGGGSEGSGGSGQDVETSPLRVSGGGSGQFRVEGGDNSIQDFGEESSEEELEEAARALHGFLVARARSEWPAACAELSGTVVDQLEALAEQAKQGTKSCATMLAAITPPLPPKVARETTIVDAGSLRVEGDRGFLLYRGEEGAVYAINMAHEGGSWKVGALAGVALS